MTSKSNERIKMHCPRCWKWGNHTRQRDNATGRYVYTCPRCGHIQVYTT